MATKIHFTKMHGAGNDYIYVYAPDYPIENPSQASILWSRPHFGIGSDGLILIGKSDVADFSMHIYNNDGSEAMMCGNGTRCVGKFVYDHHLTDKTTISLETLAGIKIIQLRIEDGECTGATVDMGEPSTENPSQFNSKGLTTPRGHVYNVGGYEGTYVCMGNPHFVIFVHDVMSMDIASEGSKLEYNHAFPERCNIEFASILPDGTIRMRVWERGSGITMACGTGACATAVAANLIGLRPKESDIQMDGGTLHIQWTEDNHILMTGPAATAFEGNIPSLEPLNPKLYPPTWHR